jgi:hypothetical protein
VAYRAGRIAAVVMTMVMGWTSRAGAQPPVLWQFDDMHSRFAVSQALKGAVTRLADRDCHNVLADFTDETGRSLSTKLAATGRTAVEEFRLLRFVDDRRAPQCRGGARLAFTQTGSHFIRVCGQHFTDWFTRNRTTTEIILIHEFLHTLGLGENPPTSEAVTERVAARCGG